MAILIFCLYHTIHLFLDERTERDFLLNVLSVELIVLRMIALVDGLSNTYFPASGPKAQARF